MKKIRYICYYPAPTGYPPRACVEAATTKIDYIVSVLNRIGYAVEIISRAPLSSKGFSFSRGGNYCIGQNILRLFPSFSHNGFAPLKFISRMFTDFFFERWLKKNLAKDEVIFVYHSLGYCSRLEKLKKKIGFKVIGEIEEIYQDVHRQSRQIAAAEYRFFQISEKYLFPNTILDEKINTLHKKSVVIHGLYKVYSRIADKFADGKIHILYSGTFDPVKGGAIAAIEASKFLPGKYHVHITGFGRDIDKQALEQRVLACKEKTQAEITFHGFLSREELITLMQRCHIGLCTQDPTSALNLTSFPSKILFYMSNGLAVLSGRNRAIEESAVADLLFYYDEATPNSIATAILKMGIPDGEVGKQRLLELDNSFSRHLNDLLHE